MACGVVDGAKIPTTWNVETGENILWKAPIAGLGLSSPVVWGDRIFITTAVAPGEKAEKLKVGLYGDPTSVYEKNTEYVWRVLCLDKKSGKVLWDKESNRGIPKVRRHPKGSHANSTPATDGKHIVAFFGSEGLYCYDMEGSLQWKKDFGVLDAGAYSDVELQWEYGSSPTIHDGKLVVQCDVQDKPFLALLDLKDGREIWRVDRKDVCSWSTPTVLKTEDRTQIICNGYKNIAGYDFETGNRLWTTKGGGDVPVCTPIVSHGLIFITNAHGPVAPIYAIDPAAAGKLPTPSDDAASRFIAWYSARGGNYMQTPIVVGDHIYFCRDNGVLTCYTPQTGEKVYSERLGKGTTGFTASPVASDGRIFFTSEEGDVYVLKAGAKYEILATNPIGEFSMATPAIGEGILLVRGQKHLFAIGETPNNHGPSASKKPAS
ncbi:MAG: PQQ-binding-like beta-propeller repeat protein [Planctomycetota bacterium]